MLAACLQGYEEVTRDNLVWFGRWRMNIHRRKLRSQTNFGQYGQMKSRDGKSQREEKSRREKIKEVRRKKMQMREKVGKSRNTVFFQWIVAPEGRKVGSLKGVQSHLGRWEMKNCTPLWREAHFEVKMYKAHHFRTTFGSWDVEKVHAVVVRSAFQSQTAQNTARSDRFWKLRCRKSARCCGAKHISKSKCTKHTRSGPLFWDVEKVHVVVARSTFRSQKFKKLRGTEHVWTFRCRFAWQAQGIVRVAKSEQNARVCNISNKDDRRGRFEEDLQRCISRGRRNAKDMFIRAVRRSGRWFPERGCIWSIRSVGLLRWFCVTGAALRMTWHHFFVTGAVL